MGKRELPFVTLLTLALLLGCVGNNVITGDGDIETHSLYFSNFNNRVILDVDSSVVISQGAPSVKITCESNNLRDFVIDTVNGVLSIHQIRDYEYIVDSCKIAITLPNIDTIEIINGSVKTSIEPTLIKSITLRGSASLDANIVHTDTLDINLFDSSHLTIRGEATVLNYRHNSSSNQNIDSLITAYANINIYSPNPSNITTTNEVRGKLESSNNLTLLWKTPIVHVECSGGSEVVYDSLALVDTSDIEN